MTYTEAMKIRTSCRSYSEDLLPNEVKARMMGMISEERTGPFGNTAHFKLIDMNVLEQEEVRKLGSYGFVRGARYFVAGVIEKKDRSYIDFGYLFERLILEFTRIGLCSCWVGGTFNRSAFAKRLDIKSGQVIAAVTPVGYSAEKGHLIDGLVKVIVGSRNRKAPKDLFFLGQFGTHLPEKEAALYHTPLECVRMAPSAVNNQPWRIVREEGSNVFHFYIHADAHNHDVRQGTAYQFLDIGVAMLHFELSALELGLEGKWAAKDPGLRNHGYIYIATWLGK